MPALPDQWIRHEAEDGTEFRQKVTASVTTEGDFHLGVPQELFDIARVLMEDGETLKKIAYHGCVGFARNRHGQSARLCCKSLAFGLRFLEACAEDYLKCEQVTERLILYKTRIDVNMW